MSQDITGLQVRERPAALSCLLGVRQVPLLTGVFNKVVSVFAVSVVFITLIML